jgi:hypothetical protein
MAATNGAPAAAASEQVQALVDARCDRQDASGSHQTIARHALDERCHCEGDEEAFPNVTWPMSI